MPYIFSGRYEYKDDSYQIDMSNAVNVFPFLVNKSVSGEILASYTDNKVRNIRKPFKCKVVQTSTARVLDRGNNGAKSLEGKRITPL